MTSRRLVVTTSSTLLPGTGGGGFDDDVSVTNTGAATAYLDTTQQSTTTSGLPLSAGSTVVWEHGRELWAVAAAAGAALVITDNAGAMFDAGAVAGQILAQGLAAQIAGQIISQNVPGLTGTSAAAQIISQGVPGQTASATAAQIISQNLQGLTAAAINALGVPPVDRVAVLASTTVVTPAGITTLTPLVSNLDVSSYATLTINLQVQESNHGTGGPNNIGQVWAYHADAGGNTIAVESLMMVGNNGVPSDLRKTTLTVPSPGARLTLYGSSQLGNSFDVIVLGSFRASNSRRYFCGHGYRGKTGNGAFSGSGFDGLNVWSVLSIPISTAYIEYPLTYAGEATLTCRINGAIPAGNGLDVFILDLLSQQVIAGTQLAGGTTPGAYTSSVKLGNAPVAMYLFNRSATAATGSLTYALTQDPT